MVQAEKAVDTHQVSNPLVSRALVANDVGELKKLLEKTKEWEECVRQVAGLTPILDALKRETVCVIDLQDRHVRHMQEKKQDAADEALKNAGLAAQSK